MCAYLGYHRNGNFLPWYPQSCPARMSKNLGTKQKKTFSCHNVHAVSNMQRNRPFHQGESTQL